MRVRARRRPSGGQALPALLALACLSLAPAARSGIPAAAEQAIAEVGVSELRAHVETLASDLMAGRGLGQPGNEQAVQYVVDALRRARVPPAAGGTYLQPIDLYQARLGDGGALRVVEGDRAIAALVVGDQFQPLPASTGESVTGRVVFAGHGIAAPQLGHDDYRGIDARGAIVFVNDGAPDTLTVRGSGDEGNDIGSVERKMTDAAARGAAGLVLIQSSLPDLHALWPETPRGPGASYRLYPRRPLAVAALADRAAEPIRRAASASPLTATLQPGVAIDRVAAHNVVGMIAGRDPGLREMVVLGAHLDHDGTDRDGTIYNGADDNASGTAAVLAIAGALARAAAAGQRPARSVAIAFWNAEEQGSLGAERFAEAPQPEWKVVANINLDMVGRDEEADPKDPRFYGFPRRTLAESDNLLHVLGYTRSPALARLVRTANASIGLVLREEYDREAQNLLQRSDHWAFLRRGIPAIFLTTGLHPDYHRPSDDADRLDYGKLERIAELAARTTWLAAQ